MKITSTVLSIPPYLSTTWENISSLHVREEEGSFTLVALLQNNVQVEAPGLDKAAIDAIFEAHARYADPAPAAKSPLDGPFSFSLPLNKGEGPINSLGAAMQHNPEQADLPPMEPEVLKKITSIAQAFGLDDASLLPQAEPHCNCVYCQVVRALHGDAEPAPQEQEIVTDEDLKFRNWEIKQTGEKLYAVSNPLEPTEHYSVFLGEPLGCTCGLKNCEHIRAVLNT